VAAQIVRSRAGTKSGWLAAAHRRPVNATCGSQDAYTEYAIPRAGFRELSHPVLPEETRAGATELRQCQRAAAAKARM